MKRIIYILFTLFSVQLSAQIEQPRIKFNQVIKDSTGVGHIVISSLDDSSMVYSADFYINPVDSTLVLFGTALGAGQLSSVDVDSIYLFGDGAANPIYLDKQRLLDSLSPFLSPNIAPGLGIDTAIVDNTVVIQSLRVEEYVKNVTTDSLYKGYPVYQVDSTLNSGNAIGVALADASDSTKMPAVGILKQDLAPGEEGVMIFSGFIQGLNTLDFGSGDIIYVAVGGGYTNVPPKTEGNLIQNLGRVIKVHETNGSGIIMGAGRANAVPNLNPGNIFYGGLDSSATTINLPTLLSDSLSAYTPLTVLADSLSIYKSSVSTTQQIADTASNIRSSIPIQISDSLNNYLQLSNYIIDSTRLNTTGDTAFYYQNGFEVGFTPIAGGGGSLQVYQDIKTANGTDSVYTINGTLPTDKSNILVLQNGQVLDEGQFTRTSSTEVTLSFLPEAGDRIVIVWFAGSGGSGGGGLSSVSVDSVTIYGDGLTTPLYADTAKLATTTALNDSISNSLSGYVTISGTETITGAKTFTANTVFDDSTLVVNATNDRVGIGVSSPDNLLEVRQDLEVGTVTDIDGNVYQTIIIGDQVWMAENLRVTKYNTGTAIPNVTDGATWSGLSTGARSYYNNDSTTNVSVYGALYNWYAVEGDSLCPTGYRVPTDAEWTILTDYLGGLSVAGGKLKEVGTVHWNSPNTGATDEVGFTALPGGLRSASGSFSDIRVYGNLWSATPGNSFYSWYRYLNYNNASVSRGGNDPRYGFSVRCMKDIDKVTIDVEEFSVDNNTLYVDGTRNRVGIGTSTPEAELSVVGNISLDSGNSNFVIGKNAGESLTSGSGNTAIGSNALQYTTSTNNNFAIGSKALQNNTIGYNNTAIGTNALRDNTEGANNFAIGTNTLLFNQTASSNLAIGGSALQRLTYGNLNTAIGGTAGQYLANGSSFLDSVSNSVYVGYFTKASANNVTNENVFGYSATGNGSNSVTLGNSSITKTILNGNVGIGTSTPISTLHVVGRPNFFEADGTNFEDDVADGQFTVNYKNQHYTAGSIDETAAFQFSFNNGGAAKLVCGKTEDFGSSANRSSYFSFETRKDGTYYSGLKLQENGLVYMPQVYATATTGTRTVYINSDGQLVANSSSIKTKDIVGNYDKGIDWIKKLNPIYYTYKKDDRKLIQAGFIAEEFDLLGLNEFVGYSLDGDADGINYAQLTTLTVKAIQEQQEQIETLQTELDAKSLIIETQEQTITDLQTENQNLNTLIQNLITRIEALENQ